MQGLRYYQEQDVAELMYDVCIIIDKLVDTQKEPDYNLVIPA